MRIRLFFAVAVTATAMTLAAATPHDAWIKAKCAVCHGEDGSGKTSNGKRTKVPDLRSKEVQKQSDAELYDKIVAGHGKMPSFKSGVTKQQAAQLVTYIRQIALK